MALTGLYELRYLIGWRGNEGSLRVVGPNLNRGETSLRKTQDVGNWNRDNLMNLCFWAWSNTWEEILRRRGRPVQEKSGRGSNDLESLGASLGETSAGISFSLPDKQ